MYQAQCERLKENPLLPNTSVIFKSDPYFDKRDRLLQVKGRLQYLDLPEGMKHPIILPYGASSGQRDHTECAQGPASCWTRQTQLALGRSAFSLPDIADEVSANGGTTRRR